MFFVVLTSVLIQGTTIPLAARTLAVDSPGGPIRSHTLEAVMSGHSGHALHEIVVPDESHAAGLPIVRLGLPDGVLIVLIERGGDFLVPQGGTTLDRGIGYSCSPTANNCATRGESSRGHPDLTSRVNGRLVSGVAPSSTSRAFRRATATPVKGRCQCSIGQE